MYLEMDGRVYDRLKGLSFAPEADLVGASLPINSFQADVYTDDDIAIGGYASLRDDLGALWANYRIVYAEQAEAGLVRIRAESDLAVLDRVTLPAAALEGADVQDVLDDIIVRGSGAQGVVIPMDYTLDHAFDGQTITGFCPEQSARERLLWVCFVIGAYVRTFFNEGIEILPIGTDAALIPPGDIYWKPAVNYGDWVTAVTVKHYSFTPGTPQATDRYVEDRNGNYYIITEQAATLRNPSAPEAAPENVVTIDGVYLVNAQNVSALLSRLALWYFRRTRLELDVIDNAGPLPGERVTVYGAEDALYTGYVERCDFAFGVQARARLQLTAVEAAQSALLTVEYLWAALRLARDAYHLPVGYAYDIQARYIDWTMDGKRIVFRPTVRSVSGALPAGGAQADVDCAEALIHRQGVLEVISADGLSEDAGVVRIT